MSKVTVISINKSRWFSIGQPHQRFRKEIRVWQGLVHPNVVPLLGTTADFGRCTGMVSPWMENGSMTAFLAKMAATLSDSARMQLVSATCPIFLILS